MFNKCWSALAQGLGGVGGGGECRRAAAGRRAPGAWNRHLQSSRPPGQAHSIKHRKKRKLKGKGQAPTGAVGIPVASNFAGGGTPCPQRPEILARGPLTSRPRQSQTTTSLSPGESEHQVFAQAETGWVGVGRSDFLEGEANTIHLATVQGNAPGYVDASLSALARACIACGHAPRVQLDPHYRFCPA